MNISPLKITRAMEEDMAESKATKLVSLQGEHRLSFLQCVRGMG